MAIFNSFLYVHQRVSIKTLRPSLFGEIIHLKAAEQHLQLWSNPYRQVSENTIFAGEKPSVVT